ncbi:O-methyltransferase [Bacteroidota bacterium]
MLKLNPELENYILENSEKEDDILQELYRQTHLKIYHPRMISGHIQGKFLEMISKMISPEQILEIGTYTGYSAICLAKGLKPGGKLITIEKNDEIKDFAISFFKKAGVNNRIDAKTGDALKIIPTLKGPFDLVFIDGEKTEYPEYFDLIIDKIKPGGYILADNVLWSGKVIEKKLSENDHSTKGIIEFNKKVRNNPDVDNVILTIRDGLMLIRKK